VERLLIQQITRSIATLTTLFFTLIVQDKMDTWRGRLQDFNLLFISRG